MKTGNGTFVISKPGESVDSLIKRFKEKYKEHRISQIYIDANSFEKNSIKRRRKHKAQVLRQRKLTKFQY
jgi:ribosomal protein S21